jgi:hypothetical protein
MRFTIHAIPPRGFHSVPMVRGIASAGQARLEAEVLAKLGCKAVMIEKGK